MTLTSVPLPLCLFSGRWLGSLVSMGNLLSNVWRWGQKSDTWVQQPSASVRWQEVYRGGGRQWQLYQKRMSCWWAPVTLSYTVTSQYIFSWNPYPILIAINTLKKKCVCGLRSHTPLKQRWALEVNERIRKSRFQAVVKQRMFMCSA